MECALPWDQYASRKEKGTCICSCALATALLVGLILIFCSLRTVPAAHLGVVVTFGYVSEHILHPGMHFCNPFAGVKTFSTKTTLLDQHNSVPTKEGLLVDLDVAILFKVKPDMVYSIYTSLGENFADVLVEPQLASQVRGFTSEGEAKALYTSGREEVQQKLKEAMEAVLEPHGILVQDVLLKAITLPEQLKKAVEAKAQAEQDADRMKFVLLKEQQEAERKSIEAKGIADFQRIVSEGISPELLQWKGIEATEKFTASSNSKLVIMGNSKASLPVMFSGDVAQESNKLV